MAEPVPVTVAVEPMSATTKAMSRSPTEPGVGRVIALLAPSDAPTSVVPPPIGCGKPDAVVDSGIRASVMDRQ